MVPGYLMFLGCQSKFKPSSLLTSYSKLYHPWGQEVTTIFFIAIDFNSIVKTVWEGKTDVII